MGCTEMACTDHVVIAFEPTIKTVGHYRFEVTVDGETTNCELDFDPARRSHVGERCDSLFVRGSSVAVGDAITEGAPL